MFISTFNIFVSAITFSSIVCNFFWDIVYLADVFMCINRSDDDDDQDQGGTSTGRASLDKNHSVCNYTDLGCLHYCFAISVRC